MASLKFFLVACMLVACVAAQVEDQATPAVQATPTDPTSGDEQITDTKRDKKDVLLTTLTYPYVHPDVPLLKTLSPISAVNPISTIHPYYRTLYPTSYYHNSYYPYSYYPYSYYPYSHYSSSVYYLRK